MAKSVTRAPALAFSCARSIDKRLPLLSSTALVAVGSALALLPGAAFAQDATWDGETNTDFTNPANWNTNAVPGPGNTVTINNGALPNQPRLNSGRTVAQTNISDGIFTVAATLTSPVTVSNTGILRMAPSGNVGGNVNVLSGGTVQMSGDSMLGTIISAPITLNGAGAGGNGALRSLAGFNLTTGAITLGSASTIATDTDRLELLSTINNNGHLLTSTGSGNTVFRGAISGAGGFTKTGSGQTDLNATNTYEGTTTVESGTLILNGGSAINDLGRVVVNGGAFGIFNDETIGSLEGTGGFVSVSVSSGTRRLTVGGNNLSTSYAGDLRNNGGGLLGLVKTGTGTLTLTNTNTYSGTTTINNGTIVAGNSAALGTGDVNFTQSGTKLVADFNGTFANTMGFVGAGTSATFAAATGRTVTITGDIITGPNAVVNFGSATETGTIVFNSAIAGNLSLDSRFAINGGTLRLANGSAALAASSLFTVTQGLTIGSGGTFDLGGISFTGSRIGGSGTILNSGAASTLTLTASSFAGTLDTGANGITLEGTLNGLGALTKRGAGRLTLVSGLSTAGYTGGLTLAEGTLSLQRTLPSTFGAITTTGSVIEYGNAIINNAPIVLNSDTTQLRVASGSATQAGQIANLGPARGFEKIGAGNLTLSSANSYEGVTTVSEGTLTVASFGALGSADGGTVVASGAGLIFSASPGLSEPITLNGTGVSGTGALRNTVTVNLGGPITLGSNSLIEAIATTTINLASVTGTNSTLTLGGAGNVGIVGALSLGSGGLIVNGTGTVSLFSDNTFTGQTTVNNGVLLLLNSQALPDSSQINVNAPGTLRVDSNETIGALTGNGTVDIVAGRTLSVGSGNASSGFSGIIQSAGMGGLTKIGTGTLTLTGANTYSGLTTISGGTLQIGDGGSSGTLGTGNVVNNAALVINRAGTPTFLNNISGSGSLTIQSGDALFLSGSNSYSGVTTISSGIVVITSANALGNTTGNSIVSAGATLANRFAGTLAEAITLNGGGVGNGGALRIDENTILSGAITLGSAARISTVAGRSSSFTGGISGTNHDLTVNTAGSISIGSALSLGTGSLIKEGVATLSLSGSNTYGATTINAGTLIIGAGGNLGSGDVLNNGQLAFSRPDSITVNNVINGTGIVEQSGSGTLTLTGANGYSGGTRLSSSGRIAVGNNSALGTGIVDLDMGSTLQLGIATTPGVSAGPITLANRIRLNRSANLDLVGTSASVNEFNGSYSSQGSVATLNGVIEGGHRLTIIGGGTLTLNGNNTYSLGTNIGQALIEVGNANAFGTGAVTLGGVAGLRNTTGGALTLGNDIAANGPGVTIGGTSNFTLTGNLSGNGTLFKVQGNTLAINSAVNDFSGVLTINGGTALVNGTMGNAGASVIVGNNGTLGGTGTIAGGVTVNAGGTLAAGQSAGTLRLESDLTLNTGSNTIFELAEAGVAGGPNNDLIRVTGTLALNGGGISVVRGTGFSAGRYTLFEFGTLSGDTDNMTLAALGGGFAGSLAVGTNVVLLNVAGAADQVRWNGSTLAPVGSVVGGSGTWDLVSSNFSNAAGTVSGPWAGNGALAIFGGTAGGGTVTIANDTVVAPSGLTFETTGYTITGGNAGSRLDLTGATGIETLAGVSATIAAPITGAGSITKNGDGTLVLTGDNSYAGGTTILAGTLQVGNGGASGTLGTGNVTNNASLVFNRADRTVVGAAISGSGTLTQQGTGEIVLAGANIYDGLTTVAAGTLRAANSTALGSTAAGTVVNAGATLAIEGELTIAEAITLNGSGVTGGGALRGVLTDKIGNQTSELQGLITLASDATITVVDRMGLIFTGPGIRGSGTQTLTFASEGTGNSTIRALGPITDIAALIKNGPGLLELGGANTFAGPVTINGGDVNLTGGAALADSVAVTMSAPARLAIAASETIGSLAGSGSVLLNTNMLTTGGNNASTSFGGVISGSLGRLTKVGTGTFTLTGANTYTGATRIEGGTLALGANDVISNSSAVQIAGGTLALGTFTDTVASVSLSSGSITGSTGSALTVTGSYFQSGGTLAAGATVNAGTPFRLDGGTIAGTLNGTAIGSNAGVVGVGSALVTGRVLMVGDLYVGQSGVGAIAVNAGGLIRSRDGVIGSAGGTGSSATVSGAGSRWEASSAMAVGFVTSGSLLIENGGVVSNDIGFVSFTAAAPGSVVVTGAGSRWENTGLLQLGMRGVGTLTIADGGAVTAANVVIARDAIATGTLIFGAAEGSAAVAAGTLASPTITLGSGAASIIFNHTAADFELAAAISGNGALRQLAGTTTLSGASTFTGTTSVLGGTLRVTGALASEVIVGPASLVNSGTISGPVTNNGTLTSTGTLGGGLVNAAGASATISGVLTGAVSNSGALTLTGATTGIGAFTQTASGVFDLGGNSTTIGSLAGAGQVQLGSATLTAGSDNASTLFTGVIAGSGGLTKAGTGTLTLRAAQTFTGLTTVNGGTLWLDAGGSLAGGVINNAVFLNESGGVSGLFVNNGQLSSLVGLRGGLTNNAGARAVLAGGINGDITNAGLVELNPGARGIGSFTQVAGGVFDLSRTSTAIGSLAGAGSVLLGAQTLTTGSNNASTSFSGVIAGSGGLTKLGTGTLTLGGANTFTGLTTVTAGTLAITASGALAGGVTNNATLTNAGSIAGAVSNAGTLTSTGTLGGGLANLAGGTASVEGTLAGAIDNAGTLTLTGATSGIGAVTQAASGVFALGGNSTAIGSLAGAGQVQLGSATLTAGSSNGSTLFSGVIAGSGGLTKAGTGTLVLTGANTFTGPATISGGALQLGDGGTTGSLGSGAITTNGALIINRSDAVTLANAITGSGMLVQDGTGTTRLTAANRYTGGTMVNRGRLVGDTAALQGAIQNNAVLEFALAGNGTFAGALSGTGRVEKTGAGILTFAGDGRNLTGPFAVLGGTLRMDGANGGRLDRAVVTLAAGTTLAGNGLIGGLVIESGALVTPGNSLGVIGVTGDVTFRAASRFLAQISDAGADLITAGGAARLAGTLEVVNLGAAAYRFNSTFTVVEAARGVSGSFDAVTFAGFSPIYRPVLRTTPTGVAVVLAPGSLAGLAGTGLTGNQAAVAARLDAAVAGGFDPQAFFGVYSLPQAQLAAALDQLSGEIHPAMGRAAMRQSRLPREAVLERAAGVALAGNPQGNSFGSWGKLMRSWGDVAAAPGTASQQTDTEGFVIGVDGGTANDTRALRFGVYGSLLNTRIAIDARGSSGEIRQTGGGAYASFAAGGFSLVAGAGAARFDVTTNRLVALPGLAGGTATTSAGDMTQLFGRIGYRFDLGAASLEPFVAGDHAWIALDPAVERGGAAALSVGRQEYKVAGATTGLALKAPLGKLRLDAEAAARFELGDRAPQALIGLAAAPGSATRISAARLAGTAFTGRLGAVLPITSRIEVRVDYAGEFSTTDTEHTAQAGLSIRF